MKVIKRKYSDIKNEEPIKTVKALDGRYQMYFKDRILDLGPGEYVDELAKREVAKSG